jgi:hypothetical protein
MKIYIMAKTESLSHKPTQDLQFILLQDKPLFLDDSKYSLSEIDLIDLIEITETFNNFRSLLTIIYFIFHHLKPINKKHF